MLFIAYLLEAGFVLIVGPWTNLWSRNYLVEQSGWLEGALLSPVTRGAVTGIGLVSLMAAGVEVWVLVRRWWRRRRVIGEHQTLVDRSSELPDGELREGVCPPSS